MIKEDVVDKDEVAKLVSQYLKHNAIWEVVHDPVDRCVRITLYSRDTGTCLIQYRMTDKMYMASVPSYLTTTGAGAITGSTSTGVSKFYTY